MTTLIFEKRGAQAWLTLNRPEARNTLNGELFVALADAWREVRDDAAIRVAVVTAAGQEDFCCGGDLGDVIPLWTGARQPATDVERRLLADPLIVDRVMPPVGAPAGDTVQFDIHMLMVLKGRERTEAEFRSLLDASEFRLVQITPLPTGQSLIEGAPR